MILLNENGNVNQNEIINLNQNKTRRGRPH